MCGCFGGILSDRTTVNASTPMMIASDSQIGTWTSIGLEQHLRPDESQDDPQPVLQQVELIHASGEQEVEGTQPEDREHVRGQDDERVVRDGEDGRDRIEGEHDVGDLDEQQT